MKDAALTAPLGRWGAMSQQRTHQQGIADVGNAWDKGRPRKGVDLLKSENTRGVAPREYEERAGFSIRRIEVNSDSEETGERGGARFSNGDAICRAVLATRIRNDWQHAILVNGYGPVGDGLLVKIGSIDREGVPLEKRRSERVNPGGCQFRTELGNRGQEVTSADDNARPVSGRTAESVRFQQLEQAPASGFRDRIADSNEPL